MCVNIEQVFGQSISLYLSISRFICPSICHLSICLCSEEEESSGEELSSEEEGSDLQLRDASSVAVEEKNGGEGGWALQEEATKQPATSSSTPTTSQPMAMDQVRPFEATPQSRESELKQVEEEKRRSQASPAINARHQYATHDEAKATFKELLKEKVSG